MLYVRCALAGIGGSILALILLIVVVVILNIMNVGRNGMVGINIIGPVPVTLALLGFALAF
jgi:hypothetical protein